jgi:uncharacterized protein YktA (UPF0223 family)
MRRVNIPKEWTGRQALSVVDFFEDVIRAVWRQHGDAMAPLVDAYRPPDTEPSSIPPDDDDVPF